MFGKKNLTLGDVAKVTRKMVGEATIDNEEGLVKFGSNGMGFIVGIDDGYVCIHTGIGLPSELMPFAPAAAVKAQQQTNGVKVFPLDQLDGVWMAAEAVCRTRGQYRDFLKASLSSISEAEDVLHTELEALFNGQDSPYPGFFADEPQAAGDVKVFS